MYTEILSEIAGIEIYPVLSLVLFVIIFAGVLLWAVRADRERLDRLAALPFDDGASAPMGEAHMTARRQP
jgi:hypothetical protein